MDILTFLHLCLIFFAVWRSYNRQIEEIWLGKKHNNARCKLFSWHLRGKQHQVTRRFLLNIAVAESAAIFELFSSKTQALLIRRNSAKSIMQRNIWKMLKVPTFPCLESWPWQYRSGDFISRVIRETTEKVSKTRVWRMEIYERLYESLHRGHVCFCLSSESRTKSLAKIYKVMDADRRKKLLSFCVYPTW